MRRVTIRALIIVASSIVAACGLVPEVGPQPVSIFVVNETGHPAVVRVGIGDAGNWRNPGTEVAWLRIVPQTYQRLSGIPVGSHLVALVVEGDCSVHMEEPWTWSGNNRDTDPANQPFWIKGGAVDMSGWGLPISEGNPIPSQYHEAQLDRVPNPCPDTF